MGYEEYILSHEIKSETKVAGIFYAFDLFFLLIYIAASGAFGSAFVHENLKLFYGFFTVCMGVFLTLPSRYNMKRRNYQSLIILFRKDALTYRPVKNVSKIRNTHEKEKNNE